MRAISVKWLICGLGAVVIASFVLFSISRMQDEGIVPAFAQDNSDLANHSTSNQRRLGSDHNRRVGGAWRVQAETISKNEFPEFVRMLLNEPYSETRQSALAAACKRLSQEAGTLEALRIISDLAGPGRNRTWMITAAISGAGEDLHHVMGIIRKLQYSDDAEACLSGMVSFVSVRNIGASEILLAAPFTSDEISAIVSGIVSRPIDGSNTIRELAERTQIVDSLLKQGGTTYDMKQLLAEYFRNLSFFAPNEALALMIDKLGAVNSKNRADYEWTLDAAFRNDPRKAMETIQTSITGAAPGSSGALVYSAVEQWMKYDLNAALAWYSKCDSYGPEIKSYAARPFFEKAIDAGDLNSAREWLNEINEPTLKKNAEGKLWSKERDLVVREVASDPTATLQAIISGSSQHADYWMEEAMSTWLTKDPAKAEDWYNKNWNSLPKGKAQYLAAAYANQALKQGDPATAGQWAALIQDPKTKQRVEAAISKAGAGGKP